MCAQKRKKTSQAKQSLLPPKVAPDGLVDRDEWIEKAASGFATTSNANRQIYRVILETLWPKGHGIPGPVVDREDIRSAVSEAKGKEYRDVFRRLRELQGDEGFLGIIKSGQKYQLIHLSISSKKKPRTSLSEENWERFSPNTATSAPLAGARLTRTDSSKTTRCRGHGAETTT